ncbi:MAG: nucleotidyltransferase [Bacteroidota bacterium]|nr:nucleotidyltransferase [Bacteroidota bacterium]
MNLFLDAHRTVLQKLIEKGVDFILIGGYAVNFHGYNRTTGDLDVWIKPDNDNKLILIAALHELDFDEEGISTINSWNFEKSCKFHIFEKPFQTEFMTHISGVKYNDARIIAENAEIDGLSILIIHINSLLQNKRSTGRTKDMADAEYLEKIIELRKRG